MSDIHYKVQLDAIEIKLLNGSMTPQEWSIAKEQIVKQSGSTYSKLIRAQTKCIRHPEPTNYLLAGMDEDAKEVYIPIKFIPPVLNIPTQYDPYVVYELTYMEGGVSKHYIGYTHNLKQRLWTHRVYKDITDVSIIVGCKTKERAKQLESLYIDAGWASITNKVHGSEYKET